MKKRITMVTAFGVMALVVGVYDDSQPAVAQNSSVIDTTALTTIAVGDDVAEYVGSKKCKKCHIKEYKSWEKTDMGKAFETLKPNAEAEIKSKFGLDPAKDYTTDPTCLECHTVGFGKPGGYAIPDPNNKKAVRKAKSLRGVGCESCHGPGGSYIDLHKEIQKSGRTYTEQEMLDAGLQLPNEAICMKCHDGRGPTKPDKPFDFESMKDEGTHEHFPLKKRSDS
jgi:cytochrome c554/c'-like protein